LGYTLPGCAEDVLRRSPAIVFWYVKKKPFTKIDITFSIAYGQKRHQEQFHVLYLNQTNPNAISQRMREHKIGLGAGWRPLSGRSLHRKSPSSPAASHRHFRRQPNVKLNIGDERSPARHLKNRSQKSTALFQ
jgi:hypothetical protein